MIKWRRLLLCSEVAELGKKIRGKCLSNLGCIVGVHLLIHYSHLSQASPSDLLGCCVPDEIILIGNIVHRQLSAVLSCFCQKGCEFRELQILKEMANPLEFVAKAIDANLEQGHEFCRKIFRSNEKQRHVVPQSLIGSGSGNMTN
mmetsp:Transcript_23928/g.48961  ORF Transcript_23928/g.48961 Transcript_23928/m.48961 type:complete len:145 (-) Transcript_23928:257-691(-)